MWIFKRKFNKEIKNKFIDHRKNRKKVMLFDEDGYIGTYPSIEAASKETGITIASISNCINGRCKKTRSGNTTIHKWVTWEHERQAELPWSINAIDYIKKWKIID